MAETPVDTMRERITGEIFFALGLSKQGLMRRLLGRLFYTPTQRFAEIFSRADDLVGKNGIGCGCRSVVEDFAIQLQVRGEEQIPAQGPLLVVSNHPGAYDSVCLASCIQRQDLKIFVWEVPFFRALPNASQKFVYATDDTIGRMLSLKNAIQHLKSGGALLMFGSGVIEPDPAIRPHTEETLKEWSPSIEIMLRKAPDTALVLAVASGVLLRKYADHPLTRIHRGAIERRRLAEVLQILHHLAAPRSVQVKACLSFAPPVSGMELATENRDARLMPAIQAHAQTLLSEHLAAYHIDPVSS